MKIDEDVKQMTTAQLRQEVMKFRKAFEKELNCTGNRRCWINLLSALRKRSIQPLSLSRGIFLKNCERYYDRNQGRKTRKTKLAHNFLLCPNCEQESLMQGMLCMRCGYTPRVGIKK